jgi:hypothetical protein
MGQASPRKRPLALTNVDSFDLFIQGWEASPTTDEKGNLDTEGFGDFPNLAGDRA